MFLVEKPDGNTGDGNVILKPALEKQRKGCGLD
jgi:hypothetical protein